MKIVVPKMRRRLSNLSEQRLYEEIIGTVGHYRAEIYRKVRIADVIDINKLPTRAIGTYALQAHFDICVCNEEQVPEFVIEFDGRGHDPRHDDKKDQIAALANLAMFRVNERLLNRSQAGMTFLQYLVHTWFLAGEFQRRQATGEFGPDEPFMMSGFLKPDAKSVFDSDFDFRTPALRKLSGVMRRSGFWIGPLDHLNMAALNMARDTSNFVAYASTSLGSEIAFGRACIDISSPCIGELDELPFSVLAFADFCEGLAIEDLQSNVEIILSGGSHAALKQDAILNEIRDLRNYGYRFLRSMGDQHCFLAA